MTLQMLEMFGRKYSCQRVIILIKIMETIPLMMFSRLISLTNFRSELHHPLISTSHLQEFSKHLHNSTANKSRPIDNDSMWKLSAEDAKRYINTSFVNLKDHNSGKCSGKTAFQFFRNKIDENQLLKIYDLCKINTDAALTPRKFGVLLHIIVLTAIKKPSLPMPKKLPIILEKILHK